MAKVRLGDVARDANVSIATATRVVRDGKNVSDEMRRRVEESIVRLGYVVPKPQTRRPLPDARIIGHILRKTHANMLFARILDSVDEIARSRGCHVITITVDDDYTIMQLVDHINALLNYNACGIIMSALGDTIDFEPMQSFLTNVDVPIVMVERVAGLIGINKVVVNAKESLFMAAKYLLDRGHRRIAYIAPDWSAEVEQQRLAGFREAMARVADAEAVFLPSEKYGAAEGYRAVAACAAGRALPTAAIANDTLMSGVLQFLYEKDIRIPSGMSLVAMDDTLAELLSPPLTSIAFPEREMAQTAIDIIFDASAKQQALARTVLLSTRLIERGSVVPPRQEGVSPASARSAKEAGSA
ncbi:MAG: LacI family transcriptional regulator [Clostridiales bacterium]|nr:LacI family transcriptional regulator [Clostridiales bacterium]